METALQIGSPIAYTLFLWWFSTGLILYLDGLPRSSFRWSLGAATVVLGFALVGLHRSGADATVGGAYLAFSCALMVWGWLEMSFLMGVLTGPRRTPCPPGSRGWQRTRYAIEAILHHELALIAGFVLVTALTFGAENKVGFWTYVILWTLRQSAKLNVFLGVRNLSEEFLPDHLRYLQTYFTRKPMNALFPVVVSVAMVASVLLWRGALSDQASDFEAAGLSFLATLMTLAVIEHWFLVLPFPADALWRWGLKSRQRESNPRRQPAQVGA